MVLNAPWVTEEQREAVGAFEAFLLDRPQQLRAIDYGFRPAEPSIALSSPLDPQHGADPSQPQTVLEVPKAEVTAGILELWRQVKRPVDVVVLMDISGSMRGEKLSSARASLVEFVNQLSDRDRLEIITFSAELRTLTELSSMTGKREEVLRRVSGIVEGGDTRLYDAALSAYQVLQESLVLRSSGNLGASLVEIQAKLAETTDSIIRQEYEQSRQALACIPFRGANVFAN